MNTFRILLAYDGTAYHGWQIQKEEATIQGIIESILAEITGEYTRVVASSRTDAGVHAFGQVASFRTNASLSTALFKQALNAMLPHDIRVIKIKKVAVLFNPRKDARKKRYCYYIENQNERSAFLHKYCWNVRISLNLADMRRAARMLMGTHDFTSFMGAGSGVKSPVRKIISLQIKSIRELQFMDVRFSGNYIRIHIEADGFLRHMVRNIVGTLVEIGRARMTPEAMREIVASHDRRNAGPTAPACGLFLEKVTY